MSDAVSYLADAWVSICAALGAATVLLHLRDLTQRVEIIGRFQFCLWVLVGLTAARVGHWDGWGWLFSAVANVSAALIPLAALLLSEGLLRRHAPLPLKVFCGVGSVVLSVFGLFQFNSLETARLILLLLFQLIGLCSIALFVFRRDPSSLSPSENRTVQRMSLSFLLILPFLATDYLRGTAFDVPVRLGGVAVLGLCWLSISMNRPGLKSWDVLRGFGIVLFAAGILTLALSGLVQLDLRTAIQAMSITLSTLILLAIWQAAVALKIEDRQLIVLRAIAEAKGQGPSASLSLLRRAAGAPDAMLVNEVDLAGMDMDDLRACFNAMPVQEANAMTDEQVIWLLSRYDATHVVLVSERPLRLVVLNRPEIAALDTTGAGLMAVQRIAADLAAEDTQCR